MPDRLIYTNSAGREIEMSTASQFFVNISKDVSGMSDVKTTIYTSTVVDADGEIETGFHVEDRSIVISGRIKDTSADNREELIREMQEVFSPFYAGILRHEGSEIREIDVRPETAPKITSSAGKRWAEFSLTLLAANPSWRASAEKEKTILTGGTTIYYEGSRACGMEIEITVAATVGTPEVAQFVPSAACSSSGDCIVTLNGTGFNVALDSGVQTSAELVATAIRAASYAGWTTGGTGTTVTFTSTTVGNKTDATYSAGSTGATGTMTTTVQGDVTADMDSFTLTNGSTVETITFRTGGGVYLASGDVLLLNISQTGITITLNDVNALERVDFTNTVFPQLYPGNNSISWNAHGDEADFTVKVRYTPLYLGK